MEEQNKEQNKEQKIDFQPIQKKPCVVEGYKSLDLFKFTEYTLEKNPRLYIISIIVLIVTQVVLDLLPSNMTMFYIANLVSSIVTFVIYILVIKKVKIEADSVNSKRIDGNLIKQILFSSFLYLLLVVFLAVIAFSLAYLYGIFVKNGAEDTFLLILGGIVFLLAIPMIAASIYFTCIVDGVIFEIFAKNNIGFSTIKATLFNLHNSKNGTLIKLVISNFWLITVTIIVVLINYAPLIDMATKSFGLMDYFMMFVLDALMAIISVYFLTNRFIIYMSCRTEK